MGFPLRPNPSAQRFCLSTGTTTATANLLDGTNPDNLVVIDCIAGSYLNGATPSNINLTLLGVDLYRFTTAAATSNSFHFDFTGGLPVWTATNSDGVPATLVSVIISGISATGSFCSLVVTYHHEHPSNRRL